MKVKVTETRVALIELDPTLYDHTEASVDYMLKCERETAAENWDYMDIISNDENSESSIIFELIEEN